MIQATHQQGSLYLLRMDCTRPHSSMRCDLGHDSLCEVIEAKLWRCSLHLAHGLPLGPVRANAMASTPHHPTEEMMQPCPVYLHANSLAKSRRLTVHAANTHCPPTWRPQSPRAVANCQTWTVIAHDGPNHLGLWIISAPAWPPAGPGIRCQIQTAKYGL